MRKELSGRVAFITGAGRGIGRATATAFWQAGASVTVVDINPDLVQEAVAWANHQGFDVEGIVADMSLAKDVDRSVAQTLRRYGRLDVLVSNAGVVSRVPVVDMSDEEWDSIIANNLTPAFLLARRTIPIMKAQQGGRIICVSSHHALQGREGAAHYSAAKAGLNSLVKSLARELDPWGITVNAVAPGPVRHIDEHRPLTRLQEHEETTPLRRMGEPDDIADVIFYFATDATSWITGQVIVVNGGGLMP